MPWLLKRRRRKRPPGRRCWLPILAMCWLVSMPTPAHGSSEPKREESEQVSAQPGRLYTEAEALAAAEAAARAAVDAAIPLAVQAAVAEERGKAAAQRLLTEARAEAYRKEALTWRALSLVAAGAGTGALANGGRGAVYGAAGGVVTALVWWLVELWPKKGGGGARP